jgi:hypothetical protein
VCGNHIVWGAQGVHEIRVRHVGSGTMARAFRGLQAELRRYAEGAPEEESKIISARRFILGQSKGEILEALMKYIKSHSIPLARTRVVEALDVAAEHEDWYGPPNTLWAAVSGLTQASQGAFADERAEIDRAAGKLLAMAF